MNIYLDIALSIIVGSLLVMNIFAVNTEMIDANYLNNLSYTIQQDGMDLQEFINHDLQKLGFGVSPAVSAVVLADSTQIQFLADYDYSGTVNTIHYYVGSTGSAAATENPNDRLLYRQVDSQPAESYAFGIVYWQFLFFDGAGSTTSDPAAIRQVEYRYSLESLTSYNGYYPGVYVRERISPKNVN